MGWVQLVRSTDGTGVWKKFEMDPFEPLGPSTHPFCFFGSMELAVDPDSPETLFAATDPSGKLLTQSSLGCWGGSPEAERLRRAG